MPTPTELAERYVALWNEPDPERRRATVRAIWSEDGGQILAPPQESASRRPRSASSPPCSRPAVTRRSSSASPSPTSSSSPLATRPSARAERQSSSATSSSSSGSTRPRRRRGARRRDRVRAAQSRWPHPHRLSVHRWLSDARLPHLTGRRPRRPGAARAIDAGTRSHRGARARPRERAQLPRDLVARDTYPLPLKPDLIPVSDGAGEIVAVGRDVTRVQPGDRVMAAIFPRWLDGPFGIEVAAQLGGSLDGMLTEYVALGQDALVPSPTISRTSRQPRCPARRSPRGTRSAPGVACSPGRPCSRSAPAACRCSPFSSRSCSALASSPPPVATTRHHDCACSAPSTS